MRKNAVVLFWFLSIIGILGATTNVYWDANGAATGAGASPSGSWAGQNWTLSSTGLSATRNWVPGGVAMFSAGVNAVGTYSVSLDAAESAAGLTFQEGTVALNGPAVLTLLPPAVINVAAGKLATINAVLSGSDGLTKSNSGTLVLNATNNLYGPVAIDGGVLEVCSAEALGFASSGVSINGGTLRNLSSYYGDFIKPQPLTIGARGATLEVLEGAILGFDGMISGSGALKKTGHGTLVVSGENFLTGPTLIENGVLKVVNFAGSATGTGSVTVNSNAILSGCGMISGSVCVNGTIAPETSYSVGPANLTTSNQVWGAGGRYEWTIKDAWGYYGPGWDMLTVNGSLEITSTETNPFVISVVTLNSDNYPGPMDSYYPRGDYTWTIVNTTAGINGFATNKFVLDTNNFANEVENGFFVLELSEDNKSLRLRYVHPPTIEPWAQPMSQTNNAGSWVMFSISEYGPTWNYQWLKNGIPLTGTNGFFGADSAYLSLESVLAEDAGTYQVVVSNAYGVVISEPAILTVIDPAFSQQPMPLQQLPTGASVTISAKPEGTPPLSLQWMKGQSLIAGATSAILVMENSTPADSGTYSLMASNALGWAMSEPAVLQICETPTIVSQPSSSITTNAGATLRIAVEVEGGGLTWQWQKNGYALQDDERIKGATNSTLIVNDVLWGDNGTYTFQASNPAGVVTGSFYVFVTDPYAGQVGPELLVVGMGKDAVFQATAAGSPELGYHWQKDGTNLFEEMGHYEGVNSATLTVRNTSFLDSGSYSVYVTNWISGHQSLPATLSVVAPPAIYNSPTGQTAHAGNDLTMCVMATGEHLSYVWMKDGEVLVDGKSVVGATNSCLTLKNLRLQDSGKYHVIVSNPAGSISSQDAQLEIYGVGVDQVLQGPANQRALAVAISSNTLFVAGESISGVSGIDGLIAGYSLPLQTIAKFQTTWPGQLGADSFRGLATASDGFYVAGGSYSRTLDSFGSKDPKGILVKEAYPGLTNGGSGRSLWEKQVPAAPGAYAFSGNETLHAVAYAQEGTNSYIYATGAGQSGSVNTGRFFLSKLDTNASILWTAIESRDLADATAYSDGRAVAVWNGGVYVAGRSDDGGMPMAMLRKYDYRGQAVWSVSGKAGQFNGMMIYGSAIYAVGASSNHYGGSDFLIEKYDESGRLLWGRSYPRSGDDVANSIAALGGRIYVGGWTALAAGGVKGAVLLEVDAETGDLLSTTVAETTTSAATYALVSDGANHLYAVGEQALTNGESSLLIISYKVAQTPVPLKVVSDWRLPTAQTNVPYRCQLQAAGGQPPYTWELVTEGGYGTLPVGLGLTSSGLISGVSTEEELVLFGVRVTDGSGLWVTNYFELQSVAPVAAPEVAFANPVSGAHFTAPAYVSLNASATSDAGITNVEFYLGATYLGSVVEPNAEGYFVIVPNALEAGTYFFKAIATDGFGQSASAEIYVRVNEPGVMVLDFEALYTGGGAVSGRALTDYLDSYGVTLGGTSAGSILVVDNCKNINRGTTTLASSGRNILTQTGFNGPVSFTLNFSQPYAQVSWTRTKLLAGNGVASHPAWQARAYDGLGNELGVVGEDLISSYTNVPSSVFTLFGQGANITTIKFEADSRNVAAVCSVLLDDLTLSTNEPVNPLPTVAITSPQNGASFAAPAEITVSAEAFSSSGAITRIDFYSEDHFIGSVGGSAGTIRKSNVGPGVYRIMAVAWDSLGGVRSSAPVTLTVTPSLGTSVINFDALDARTGSAGGLALGNYLSGFGVSVTNLTAGTRMEVVNSANFSGGSVAVASSPNNFLLQVGVNIPVTFTMAFAQPIQNVTFTRVSLVGSAAGVTHPQWRARAFGTNGMELAVAQEALFNAFTNVPAKTFTLSGSDITSLRFESDGQGRASFPAPLLDDFIVSTNGLSNAFAVSLNSPANGAVYTLPATITLVAQVTNWPGAADHVEFYAGAQPIATNVLSTTGEYSYVWSNAVPGVQKVWAKAVDASGVSTFSGQISLTVNAGTASNLKVLNFDAISASNGPVSGTVLSNYLAGYGVSLASIGGGTVAVQNQRNVSDGQLVMASSGENVLAPFSAAGPVSFTLQFRPLLDEFRFTRPKLRAGGNRGVTHPGIQAFAFDAAGNQLSTISVPAISSYSDVDAQTYKLTGTGISSIKFAADGGTFSSYNGLLLDDFMLALSTGRVGPAVVVTAPVADEVFIAPGPVAISATAIAGSANVTRVQFYAGANLVGTVTTAPYSMLWSNVPAGRYQVKAIAFDSNGESRESLPVSIAVDPRPEVFGILNHPKDQTVGAGASVTFYVVATGTNAFSYQWRFAGADIPGATNSSLTLANVSLAQAGDYSVAVSSMGNTLVSGTAHLFVLQPPAIVVQPQGLTLAMGANASLTVQATGSEPLTYQWLLNGTRIVNATNSSFSLEAAQPHQSGKYQVVIANPLGAIRSEVVNVVVLSGNSIQPQVADAFAARIGVNPLLGPIFGNNEAATREASEPNHAGKPCGKSIWYSWRANFSGVVSLSTRGSSFDTLLAVYTGTNLSALTLVAADDDSGGYFASRVTFNVVEGTDYQIAVDGFRAASGTIILSIPTGGYRVFDPNAGIGLPRITIQPSDQIVHVGDAVSLAVLASSATPLSYQWFFNDAPIQNATLNTLTLTNFAEEAIGRYYVFVGNDAGSIQSRTAVIQVGLQDEAGVTSNTSEDKLGNAADLENGEGEGVLSTSSVDTRRVVRPHSGGDSRGYSLAQTFSTVGSTKDPEEPDHCGQPGGASEWYAYTAPTNGMLHISTEGSAFNTILAVYTGPGDSYSTLTNIDCGYTTNYLVNGQPHIRISNVPAGQRYFIVVDGLNGASGTVRLNVNLGEPPQIVTPPQNSMVGKGANAIFNVAVTGTTNYFYRWRFNSAFISGASSSSYTVVNVQEASLGNYSVVVSNPVAVVTSTPPASLALQLVPLITASPTNVTALVSSNASFYVSAIGASPLKYQWRFNGSSISKATNSYYTVSKCKMTNAGAFSVVVSNIYGTVTSPEATLTVLDLVRPTAAFSAPANNARTNLASIMVRGTAKDNVAVKAVRLKVGESEFQTVTGTNTWSMPVTLSPGTNVLTLRSIDSSDNESLDVVRKVFYVVPAQLTVRTNGLGRITSTTGATNSALLEIGRDYTVKALVGPGTNWLFSNWVAGTNLDDLAVISTNSTLVFRMSANLIVQGNFVTNPFIAGTFNGLFFPTNGITHQSSGLFSLAIAAGSKGAFSGNIQVEGVKSTFNGVFNMQGDWNGTINRTAAGKTPIAMALHLNLDGAADEITGTLSNTAWLSELVADRCVFNGSTRPASNFVGRFTMAIPPTEGAPLSSPAGYGYVTVSNTLAGSVALAGVLADGTTFSQASYLSKEGHVPLYAPLYLGKGCVLGWLHFTNTPPKSVSARVSWLKESSAGGAFYPAGLINEVDVLGSVYVPPVGARILALPTATMTIADGNLNVPLVFGVALSTANVVTKVSGPTNGLSVTFTPKTGEMLVSFRPTGFATNKTAKGIVLQNGPKGVGAFRGQNQTGSVILE